MSLKNQQDLLAKLFTDSSLRQSFIADPHSVSKPFGLTKEEIEGLILVVPAEIESYSRSLISKRLNEAEKHLPLVKRLLGDDFRVNFRRFADEFNTLSPQKHLADATAFCGYIMSGDFTETAKEAAKFERTKLDFYFGEKRFAFCGLSYDIPGFATGDDRTSIDKIIKKRIFAVWFRAGKKVYFRVW